LIVASVSIFFLFQSGLLPQIGGKQETSANVFLDSCLEDVVDEAVELVLKNGGYTESSLFVNFQFAGEKNPQKVSYLCYNQADHLPCVNQQPVLFQSIAREISNYIERDVENCFDEMVKNFESQRFDVASKYNGFELSLKPGRVEVQTNSEVTLTKSGEASTQRNFKVVVNTRLYELANVVSEILRKEALTCGFSYRGYELLYPKFNIEKTIELDSSSDIYTVEYLNTNEKFIFAVRGCIIPPGF
jgi:hypothetical protein